MAAAMMGRGSGTQQTAIKAELLKKGDTKIQDLTVEMYTIGVQSIKTAHRPSQREHLRC